MFEFVELTDGTDSTACEITDGIRYALAGYNFQVAPLSDSDLGADGPYADVTEQITFHALGCTAAEAYANASAVNDILDQAWRWARGDAVAQVVIRLRAQNSETTLEGVILGRAPGSPPNLAMPAVWSEYHDRYLIQNITAQFVRHGRLLLPTTDTVSVAAAAVPTVMAINTAIHSQLSPVRVDFTGAPGGAGSTVIIAVGPVSSQVIIEAEGGTLGPDVASVADAANSARGGSVARYTAPAIPTATDITLTISGIATAARRFVVLMAVRKNQTTSVFDLSASLRKVNGATAVVMATTETERVSSTNQNPQLLIFDPVTVRDQPNSLVINITPITAVAGNTFDIDYVAVIQVDDNACAMLAADWPSLGANETISIDPLVTEPQPRVQVIASGINFPMTYMGNPWGFGMRDGILWASLFATGGASDPNRWRMYNAAGAAVAQLGLTIQRQRAYLIPE